MADKVVRPVYYDEETKNHKPLEEGAVIDASVIPLSKDAGNGVKLGSDKGLFADKTEVASLVSAEQPNYLGYDAAGLLKIDGNSILSNGATNLLKIDPTDKKVVLSRQDFYQGFYEGFKAANGVSVETTECDATVSAKVKVNGGIAFDADGAMYISFAGMSAADLKALLTPLIKAGGGLTIDENGQLTTGS